jgi:transposase
MTTTYTVAIDLSKYKHTATIAEATTGEVCQTINFAVNQAGFCAFEAALQSYSTDPKAFIIGCEATGHYGETLLRRLQRHGYTLVRMNPAQVAQFRRGLGRKAKTDALDAEAMAKQLAVTDWVADRPITETLRQLRSLTRLRLDFVQEQSRWINRIRSVINQIYPEIEPLLKKLTSATSMAILSHYPSRQALAQAPLDELTALVEKVSRQNKGEEFAQQLQQTAQDSVGLDDACLAVELSLMMSQFTMIAQNIRQIEREIRQVTTQLLQEYSDTLGLETSLTLKSFPYGNYLSIATLLSEIGDVQRFGSLKQLLSYLGWCPNTQESGTGQVKHPRMSHRGNRFARRVLWLMAVGAVRWIPEYQLYFHQRVKAGKNKMKTLVAIGRKLLSVFYAVLRTGQAYDPHRYLERTTLPIAA